MFTPVGNRWPVSHARLLSPSCGAEAQACSHLVICYLKAAQSCFLPLSVHLQPAGHHTGPFSGFWDEPPFPLIQPLACAFPEPYLKVPTTPIVGLQPCPWLGFWPLFMSLFGLGILAILLGHSWAEPARLETHISRLLSSSLWRLEADFLSS